MPTETYLGDGLYASHDGYQYKLYAESGSKMNEVYLEPEVLHSFIKFIERMNQVKITIESRDNEKV